MVVAPVAEASVDLCTVASGLVCLPCLPPFAINKAQAAGGGGSAAGNKLLRTDGDLSSPVQWRNAQGQRAAVRSLVGRTAASCHMPKQRKREAKERRRVWLRCFVPAASFCQPQPYLLTRSFS